MGYTKQTEKKNGVNVDSDCVVEMVNAATAAAIVGVSLRSWWRFVSEGKAPQPIRIRGCVRWRVKELRQWIADGCESVAIQEGDHG